MTYDNYDGYSNSHEKLVNIKVGDRTFLLSIDTRMRFDISKAINYAKIVLSKGLTYEEFLKLKENDNLSINELGLFGTFVRWCPRCKKPYSTSNRVELERWITTGYEVDVVNRRGRLAFKTTHTKEKKEITLCPKCAKVKRGVEISFTVVSTILAIWVYYMSFSWHYYGMDKLFASNEDNIPTSVFKFLVLGGAVGFVSYKILDFTIGWILKTNSHRL